MRTVTKISQLTVAAALGLSLAACGSSSSSGGSTSAGGATSGADAPASASGGPSDAGSAGATGQSSSAAGEDQAGVPDAKTLVHEARTAYGSAKSASMHADVRDSDGSRQKLDIKGTLDGTNQEVTNDQGTPAAVATIRTVDDKYYMKGNATFWAKSSRAPAATAKLLANKWVIAPASSTAGIKELTIKNFLNEVMGPSNLTDAKLEKATTSKTTYDGQDAYVVKSARTKNTITIAADTKLVLEVDGEQGSTSTGEGKITLTNWNKQARIAAPSGAIKFPTGAK